jgi:hypothetical protein
MIRGQILRLAAVELATLFTDGCTSQIERLLSLLLSISTSDDTGIIYNISVDLYNSSIN